MALLIDVGDVPPEHCDCCIETMFKSMAEDPAGDARSIWTPHDNPWIESHVEEVTRRFQRILRELQEAFSAVLTGKPLTELAKSDAPWLRWDQSKFDEVKLRLESKAPARYTLDDWMDMVDFLIQTYLPDGVIQSEAEYLTVRASMLGKLQDAMESGRKPMNRPDIEAIVDLMPVSFGLIPPKVLTKVELSTIHIAKASAAIHIGDLADRARSTMRTMIIEHVQAQMLGMKEGQYTALRQRLFDSFGQLNRDFRRIAVTEAGECCNQGFIGAQKPGTRVRRQEAYKGVCPFCASINGKVFNVVEPDQANKQGETEVWVGKSNVGRSASPRKRSGSQMVEREPKEMWWPAAGVQHPHCRGAWVALADAKPNPSAASIEFRAWLEAKLASVAPKIPA